MNQNDNNVVENIIQPDIDDDTISFLQDNCKDDIIEEDG